MSDRMSDRLSASAAQLCEAAREVGLLAAMSRSAGVAGHVLHFYGLHESSLAKLPVITDLTRVIEPAVKLADKLGHELVASDHLLRVVVDEHEQAMQDAGIDVVGLGTELDARLGAVRGENVSGDEMSQLFGG